MLLKIIVLLGLSLQLQIRPSSTLDFSQFYLPQCCYHPHSGIPAAPTDLDQVEPFRHDIRARKVDPAQIIKLNNNHNHSTTETEESALTTALLLESNADKREIKNHAGNKNSARGDSIPESSDDGQGSTLPGGERAFSATRLYRYIIPMDKLEKSNVTTTTTTATTRSHLLARNTEETTTSSPREDDFEDSTTTTVAPTTTIMPTEKTTAKPRSRSSLPTSLSSRLREQGKTRKSFRKELKTEFKLKQLLSSAQIEAELKPDVDEAGTAPPKKREAQDEAPGKETEGENTTPSLENLLSPQNTTMAETESTLKFKRNTMTNAEQRLRRTNLKRLQPQSSQQQHPQLPKPLGTQNQNYIDKMMDINHKMPSSWIINLRRALYQSIDSMLYHTQSKSKSNKGKSNSRHSKSKKSKSESTSNESSESDETIQAKSTTNYFNPHRNRPDSTSQEDLNHHNQRFSLLWPQLREANLTLVEPLTRSETMLPENIYLPTGTGPVASGVVVNTVNGIQLRMASELYFQQDNPHPQHLAGQGPGGCNCHLIQNGDILMAYWSVSRIVNENGNPSLQYLIYPVPYNVPTPPRIENFNTQVFEPSMGFQDNPHQQHHHHHHHRRQPKPPHPQPQPHSPQGGYPIQNQNPIPHNNHHHHHQHHPQQNQIQTQLGNPSQQQQYEHHEAPPPYLQETPFNHHIQLETDEPLMSFPPNYETVFRNLQQFNQLPPTIGGRPESESDFRGVVIQTENGYTPEFVELYKQAVANHLVHKDQHEHHQHQQNLNQLTPFQQLQQYILKQQQAQGIIGHPGGPGQGPTQGPGPHHNTPRPPAHIQLFDGLQQADPNPNNPNFPKSIQEIISPFAGGPVPPGSVIINPTSLPIIPVSGPPPPPPPPQQQFTGLVALDPSNFQHPISVLPAGVHPNQQQQQQHQHPQQPHDKKINVNNYYTFDHQGPIDAYTGPIHPNHPQQPQQPQLPQSHEQGGHGHGPPIQNYPNNVNFPNTNNINYPRHPHPPNNPNNQHSSFYENDKHSNHAHHHNPYKPSPHRPTNNDGGGGRYPPNSEEEMRYHRTQQVPIRQRPQSYSRPSSSSSHIGQSHRRFNQDGSYIINF